MERLLILMLVLRGGKERMFYNDVGLYLDIKKRLGEEECPFRREGEVTALVAALCREGKLEFKVGSLKITDSGEREVKGSKWVKLFSEKWE